MYIGTTCFIRDVLALSFLKWLLLALENTTRQQWFYKYDVRAVFSIFVTVTCKQFKEISEHLPNIKPLEIIIF